VALSSVSPDWLRQFERRQTRRLWVGLATIALIFVPVTAYVAVTLHDEHVQACVILGPTSESQRDRCDRWFPLHNHVDLREQIETRLRHIDIDPDALRDLVEQSEGANP